jgi:hypothetical protein
MDFKFRKSQYRVELEAHCYALTKKVGDEYTPVGYYKDIFYLFKMLVDRHVITAPDAKSMKQAVESTCNELKEVVLKALK